MRSRVSAVFASACGSRSDERSSVLKRGIRASSAMTRPFLFLEAQSARETQRELATESQRHGDELTTEARRHKDSSCSSRKDLRASVSLWLLLFSVSPVVSVAFAGCGGRQGPPQTSSARPVLFIGLDGADWQLLDDYMARGAMPNLAALVREGTSGILETIHPPRSPLVWTTMMTGVGPLDHGILDFIQFDPQSG